MAKKRPRASFEMLNVPLLCAVRVPLILSPWCQPLTPALSPWLKSPVHDQSEARGHCFQIDVVWEKLPCAGRKRWRTSALWYSFVQGQF